MTTLDLITQAATTANVVEQGQTLSAEESAYILLLLNQMLDSWNTERLNLYSVASAQYTLTANVGAYAIGPTAASPFTVARPALIQNANIIYSGLAFELEMMNSTQWASLTERDNVAKVPTKLYYDNAFPNGNLNLNPAPICATTTKIELFTWTILAQFAALSDTVSFPTGYMEPVHYNLAAALPSAFGLQLDPLLAQKAMDSKTRLRGLNSQILAGPVGQATTEQTPAVGLPTGGQQ